MKSKIKAVVFDVGGVLKIGRRWAKGKEHEGVHQQIAKKLKMDLDSWFDSIDSIFADSIEGKVDGKTVIKVMSNNLNINSNKLIKLFKKAHKRNFKKNKKLYKIAFKLKDKGYKIGIVSDQWHLSKRDLMPKKDIKGFDVVLISCDAHLRKQNPEMFKLLIKKLKKKNSSIKASEILFIDNRTWNLKPAEKLGIKTILFENNKQVIKKIKEFDVCI